MSLPAGRGTGGVMYDDTSHDRLGMSWVCSTRAMPNIGRHNAPVGGN